MELAENDGNVPSLMTAPRPTKTSEGGSEELAFQMTTIAAVLNPAHHRTRHQARAHHRSQRNRVVQSHHPAPNPPAQNQNHRQALSLSLSQDLDLSPGPDSVRRAEAATVIVVAVVVVAVAVAVADMRSIFVTKQTRTTAKLRRKQAKRVNIARVVSHRCSPIRANHTTT